MSSFYQKKEFTNMAREKINLMILDWIRVIGLIYTDTERHTCTVIHI